jgi:hypothetical protein
VTILANIDLNRPICYWRTAVGLEIYEDCYSRMKRRVWMVQSLIYFSRIRPHDPLKMLSIQFADNCESKYNCYHVLTVPTERAIEAIRPVSCCHYNDLIPRFQTVHQRQKLGNNPSIQTAMALQIHI